MPQSLVIVESPAKARTISRFLGPSMDVKASMGHVRDLAERKLSVDIKNNFTPEYEISDKRGVLKLLKESASHVDDIYLATDPDREGEAIAWHLKTLLEGGKKKHNFHRITFHEITRNAINNSLKKPGQINENLVNSQQARRVLDRIVGYMASPLLWSSVGKGTSAGRVQTVALRLIVEREREIQAFKPEEYWNLDAVFSAGNPPVSLKTRLVKINGCKLHLRDGKLAATFADAIQDAATTHQVARVTSTPRLQHPAAPFITSTLQQAAGSFLKFGTKQTMDIAQNLYEGIDIGEGGPSGLITYMRTDSVNIAKEAQDQARDFISKNYGPEYVPQKPNFYRSRKTAQEAHEAIRPTDVTRTPDSLVKYLDAQQLKLYRLIWNRFVASQMASAQQVDHAIEVESNGPALDVLPWQQAVDKATPEGDDAPIGNSAVICTFRTAARETKFPGYLIVYSARDLGEEDEMDDKKGILPSLPMGQPCELTELGKEQGFTAPPSRFTEASLVKALEQNGVGRPSTFASTVSTIISRKYVGHQKGSLVPTELGYSVNDFLVQRMPELFNVGFTAKMETELDEIEEGKLNWTEMLRDFYEQFQTWMGTPVMVISKSDEQDVAKRLGQLFPDDFAFDKPGKGAQGKTYDDKKFITSLRKQVLEKKKDLTERQWSALFATISKYYERDNAFRAKVDAFGWGENIRSLAQQKAQEPPHHADTTPLSPAALAMFEAMRKVEWQEPIKRGKRIYDDGRFFRSLYKAASGEHALTSAQYEAFQKLAEKYSAKIPDFAQLAADLNWAQEEKSEETHPVLSDKQQLRLQALVDMVGKISKWNPPSSRGKRSFNDKEFANSLLQQFQLKGELSPRQISALEKMLGKYSAQFSAEDQKLLSEKQTPKPELLEERCPKCNAPLIKRMGPRGPFIGCSAFPKCNYIAKKEAVAKPEAAKAAPEQE